MATTLICVYRLRKLEENLSSPYPFHAKGGDSGTVHVQQPLDICLQGMGTLRPVEGGHVAALRGEWPSGKPPSPSIAHKEALILGINHGHSIQEKVGQVSGVPLDVSQTVCNQLDHGTPLARPAADTALLRASPNLAVTDVVHTRQQLWHAHNAPLNVPHPSPPAACAPFAENRMASSTVTHSCASRPPAVYIAAARAMNDTTVDKLLVEGNRVLGASTLAASEDTQERRLAGP